MKTEGNVSRDTITDAQVRQVLADAREENDAHDIRLCEIALGSEVIRDTARGRVAQVWNVTFGPNAIR